MLFHSMCSVPSVVNIFFRFKWCVRKNFLLAKGVQVAEAINHAHRAFFDRYRGGIVGWGYRPAISVADVAMGVEYANGSASR